MVSNLTRRRFFQAAAVAAGMGAGAGLYTWRWEPHWVEVVARRLPIANLPGKLDGARLVQLSDLHIGPQVDDAYLLRVFERVRSLAPEIVVYTGDFISYEAEILGHARSVFARLPTGSRATFGILGNHDYGPAWAHPEIADQITTLAGQAGVQMLRNTWAEIDGLRIAGMDDFWADRFEPARALEGLGSRQAALVLSHNPDTVDQPGWGAFDGWILCGHTHGGQCKPPFLPSPMLPVRNRRYQSGEYELSGGRKMYISRGVGHLLRARFNARPEITMFHLEPC